jgi:hypothetical protein
VSHPAGVISAAGTRVRTPGDLLLHPAAIAALVVVIVNDRVLKVRYPSEVSGKLSDFAGLVFFPLFMVAAIEAVRWLYRRSSWQLTSRAVVVAVVVVGVAMVAIKTWQPAGDLYRTVMGAVLYPVDAVSSVARGDGLPILGRVNLVQDRTDLFALPFLIVPVWVARRVMDAR